MNAWGHTFTQDVRGHTFTQEVRGHTFTMGRVSEGKRNVPVLIAFLPVVYIGGE